MSEGMVVALIGLRCSGKTTVGRALAERLGHPFRDLDDAVAETWAIEGGKPVAPVGELYERLGEPGFRALEAQILGHELERDGHRVLATGGGCVETPASCLRLASEATCVWLRAPVAELQRRMRADPTPRPALEGDDPVDELAAVAERREPLYAAVAHVTVDVAGLTVDAIVDRIIEAFLRLGSEPDV